MARRLLLFGALFGLLDLGGSLVVSDIVGHSAVALGAAVVAGLVMLRRDGKRPGALGFYLHRDALPEAGFGVALGTVVAATALILIAATGGVRWQGEAGDLVSWLVGAGAALALLALPAAAEEALFRGYPMQLIAAEKGPVLALWLMSAGFAAVHVWNPGVTGLGVVNILAAGLLLGVVYLKTGSLWWATGAHLGWNWALGYLGDLPVSGLELMDAPLVMSVVSGPTWLSGGSFGPEGSALTAVALLCTAGFLWRARWLSPGQGALESQPLAFGPAAAPGAVSPALEEG